jgi:uracil-DNA glycosylase family 4
MRIISFQPVSQSYQGLLNTLAKCSLCPKMVEARQILRDPKPIPPFGAIDQAYFFLIGIAPGRMPLHMKSPHVEESAFRYGSGEVLRRVFNDLQLPESLFFISNIFKCNTPADKIFLEEDGLRCTSLYLRQELNYAIRCQCRHVILLGQQAADWFRRLHLSVAIPITTVWHPSYVLRHHYRNYQEYLNQWKFLKQYV